MTEQVTPLAVGFFGRFRCELDGRSIPWIRRMDKRIFAYLVLTVEGRSTREEIKQTFWSAEESDACELRLRTACSNIRNALAAVAGADQVARYFCTAGDALAVSLENVTVDVRRYVAHMRSGNTAYAGGAMDQAVFHYRQALALYTADIGWGDEPEPALRTLGQECAILHRRALERVARVLRERGAQEKASEYESMLSAQIRLQRRLTT